MDEDMVAKAQRGIRAWILAGSNGHAVKETLQMMAPKGGPESIESFATRRVLIELRSILLDEDVQSSCDSSEPSQSKEPPVISSTDERWYNEPSIYTMALLLIRWIDPEKGAISTDYSETLLRLFIQKFSNGEFHDLWSIEFLCQYSAMNSGQYKQLLKSFLVGAKQWLGDKYSLNGQRLLGLVRMLDASCHSDILQNLEELDTLIDASYPHTTIPLIMEKLKQLEMLIEEQDTIHFQSLEIHRGSWRREDARKQRRDTRKQKRDAKKPSGEGRIQKKSRKQRNSTFYPLSESVYPSMERFEPASGAF